MIKKSPTCAAIILAAGSSSRMGGGRHKLLLPLAGRPVLSHVLDATIASQAHPVLVVLGYQAEQVRTHLAPYSTAVQLIENTQYLQGMSTSMRLGLQVLMKTALDVGSVLIILGDQPLITAQTIDTLIETWRTSEKLIVAPLYNGQRGNPTLFDARLFPELLEVTGDEGGRRVLERHRAEMATIDAGNSSASYDVDTWEAYQQVVEAWQRLQDQ
jgi:molybdenum cofactor cytidylyltransferase